MNRFNFLFEIGCMVLLVVVVHVVQSRDCCRGPINDDTLECHKVFTDNLLINYYCTNSMMYDIKNGTTSTRNVEDDALNRIYNNQIQYCESCDKRLSKTFVGILLVGGLVLVVGIMTMTYYHYKRDMQIVQKLQSPPTSPQEKTYLFQQQQQQHHNPHLPQHFSNYYNPKSNFYHIHNSNNINYEQYYHSNSSDSHFNQNRIADNNMKGSIYNQTNNNLYNSFNKAINSRSAWETGSCSNKFNTNINNSNNNIINKCINTTTPTTTTSSKPKNSGSLINNNNNYNSLKINVDDDFNEKTKNNNTNTYQSI
ncbi:hypothetical protein CYY_009253 [Polysphondylium violaceum]|uniref:Transmembrane protein n=1 Tax=Polysphondylium violaceum TaxID=133409 RepID=A0A8J4PTY7_9MYCE|nr:hypothetical protein CYY_009253 [Polysphondylium violaceum]